MLKPGDIEIVRMAQGWAKNEYGNATPAINATFTVRKHGPYTVSVPREGFTSDKMKAAIEEFASHICDSIDCF